MDLVKTLSFPFFNLTLKPKFSRNTQYKLAFQQTFKKNKIGPPKDWASHFGSTLRVSINFKFSISSLFVVMSGPDGHKSPKSLKTLFYCVLALAKKHSFDSLSKETLFWKPRKKHTFQKCRFLQNWLRTISKNQNTQHWRLHKKLPETTIK